MYLIKNISAVTNYNSSSSFSLMWQLFEENDYVLPNATESFLFYPPQHPQVHPWNNKKVFFYLLFPFMLMKVYFSISSSAISFLLLIEAQWSRVTQFSSTKKGK